VTAAAAAGWAACRIRFGAGYGTGPSGDSRVRNQEGVQKAEQWSLLQDTSQDCHGAKPALQSGFGRTAACRSPASIELGQAAAAAEECTTALRVAGYGTPRPRDVRPEVCEILEGFWEGEGGFRYFGSVRGWARPVR
jgi:hypothetical protein